MAANNPSNSSNPKKPAKKTPAKKTQTQANSSKKKNGKSGKRLVISIVILVLLAGGFLTGLFLYEDKIDTALGFRKVETYNTGEMVSIGGLNIHFIDVGQGDACLVELPDNRVMLIDAGDNGSTVEKKLKSYIEEVNAAREETSRPKIVFFDYVVITHSDSDHIGSMAYILDLYPAATLYRPNQKCTASGYTDPAAAATGKNGFWAAGYGEKGTTTYKNALTAGYKQHDNFKEGIVTNPYDSAQNCIKPNLSDSDGLYYEVNFYGPVKAVNDSKNNNYSPIIIIDYKDRRVALSGDAEKEGERDFVDMVNSVDADDRYAKVKSQSYYADIIKLGHHGSDTSSTAEYLSLLSKNYAENIYIIISVNEDAAKKNQWTHPHPEAMARVENAGFKDEKILRTDEDGDVFLAFNFYQGQERALVQQSRGDPVTEVTYPYLNGLIRYRNIGIAVIVVLALILLPSSYFKKAKKQAEKAVKQAGKK